MSQKLRKLFTLVFALLVPLGLVVLLFATLIKPFNLISQMLILLSPYRKLLPYIIAQARHETDDFKSVNLKTHNNLFGMKHPTKRPSVGEKGDPAPELGSFYQRYSTKMQSVRDYLMYLAYVNFPTSVSSSQQFVDALASRGYFGYNPSTSARAIYLGGINRFAA